MLKINEKAIQTIINLARSEKSDCEFSLSRVTPYVKKYIIGKYSSFVLGSMGALSGLGQLFTNIAIEGNLNNLMENEELLSQALRFQSFNPTIMYSFLGLTALTSVITLALRKQIKNLAQTKVDSVEKYFEYLKENTDSFQSFITFYESELDRMLHVYPVNDLNNDQKPKTMSPELLIELTNDLTSTLFNNVDLSNNTINFNATLLIQVYNYLTYYKDYLASLNNASLEKSEIIQKKDAFRAQEEQLIMFLRQAKENGASDEFVNNPYIKSVVADHALYLESYDENLPTEYVR